MGQVNHLLAQRRAVGMPQDEAQLLQQINQGLPEAIQQRYNELRSKLCAETITPQEHEELLSLSDAVEQADADRLQHLIHLSQLRQVPLPDLMNQLGIYPPSVHT